MSISENESGNEFAHLGNPAAFPGPAAHETFNGIGFSPEEARAAAKENVNFLAALVLGDTFTVEFSESHLSFWGILTTDIVKTAWKESEDYSKFAFGIPRGFAKTTLMKLYCLWVILFTPIEFILVVSANEDKAIEFISDVCDFLDSPNIVELFGNWRGMIETDRSEKKKFRFNGKNVILHAIGAGTSVRGVNIKNKRPQLIICEDIQERETALSPTLNDNFIKWFLGTLLKVRDPRRAQIVNIGNMYNENCLLDKLRKSPEWFSLITSGILAGKKSLWPEFRSYESLLSEFRNDFSLGHPEIFLAEVMNDPLATVTANFDITKIPKYPYEDNIFPDGAFITVDPALGLKHSDDTSISLHYVINGEDVVRKQDNGKYNDEQTVQRTLKIAIEEQVPLIAVEAVAYQATLLNYFIREMNAKSITGIQVVPVAKRGMPKNTKIGNFLRKLLAGEVRVHPDAAPIIYFQAARFNPTRKDNEDDALDSASMGELVLQEHWHEVLLNGRTFDAAGEGAEVRGVEENSPF